MKVSERGRPSPTDVASTRSALVLRARRTLRALESTRGVTPDDDGNRSDVVARLSETLKAYVRSGVDGDPILRSELLAVVLEAERRAGLPALD